MRGKGGVASVQILRFLSRDKIVYRLQQYFSSALLIWLAIGFFRTNPYYKNFLLERTQDSLLLFAVIYTVAAFVFYLLVPLNKLPVSRGYLILNALARVTYQAILYLRNFPIKPSYPVPKLRRQEKIAILFLIVKLFFIPLMLNFMYQNYDAVRYGLSASESLSSLLTISSFNAILFPLLFSLLLLIDTVIFAFGYLVESRFLGNTVRSVDPTVLGWSVALVSYPPFNGFIGNYIPWYANDYVKFSTPTITFIMYLIILVLMAFYAFASVALGPKASNLTNRGIVGWGPYRLVRHPAYASKNLAWWLSIIPVFSVAAFASMLAWSVIYYLRAITEERHLIRDPDYQAYCQKVRYRFIPGIW